MARNQEVSLMSAQSAAASVTQIVVLNNGIQQGCIMASTDSTYNGTTGTFNIKASNDNVNYTQVYADDDVTALSVTLAASSNYSFLVKKSLYKYYALIYINGDATIGILTANFIGQTSI